MSTTQTRVGKPTRSIQTIKSRPASSPPNRYLALATLWQPRPIRSNADYARAAEMLDRLVTRNDLDRDERDYLAAVTTFVEQYDDEHHPLPPRTATTPSHRIAALVGSANLSVNQLGSIVGSQPLASMLLSGKRQPSKLVAKKLAAHFKLDVAYFL